jgi:hypothetical protein
MTVVQLLETLHDPTGYISWISIHPHLLIIRTCLKYFNPGPNARTSCTACSVNDSSTFVYGDR